MKETEAAWLAGLVDGEGAIWCRWPKRTNVVVELKMTHLPTLERVNTLFPGRLVKGHLSGMSVKPQWRWTVDTLKAATLLELIYPYMVTKQHEAWAARQLCLRPIDKPHMDYWSLALASLR